MTDDEFIQAFEAAAVGRDDWTHEAHIRMAWIYATREDSLADATARARQGIQRLNAANGIEAHLYHETVTCAFMALVHARVGNDSADFDQFLKRHSDLLDTEKPILRQHYTRETLASAAARTEFVPPHTPF